MSEKKWENNILRCTSILLSHWCTYDLYNALNEESYFSLEFLWQNIEKWTVIIVKKEKKSNYFNHLFLTCKAMEAAKNKTKERQK